MGRFEDLTGMVFGELTVVKRAPNYILPCGKPQTMWECKCSCGKIFTTRALQLKNGESISCGHKQKEIARDYMKAKRKGNRYDLSGNYGIGYTNSGKQFLFDLEDYDKIKNYTWYISNWGYVVGSSSDHHNVSMTRLIMNVKDETIEIDHIHGKESILDNRKSNLRIVNKSQNAMNQKPHNSSTHMTGVSFDKRRNKWRARIKCGGKDIHIGYYITLDEAAAARTKAEDELFGEYSYKNSQRRGIL